MDIGWKVPLPENAHRCLLRFYGERSLFSRISCRYQTRSSDGAYHTSITPCNRGFFVPLGREELWKYPNNGGQLVCKLYRWNVEWQKWGKRCQLLSENAFQIDVQSVGEVDLHGYGSKKSQRNLSFAYFSYWLVTVRFILWRSSHWVVRVILILYARLDT